MTDTRAVREYLLGLQGRIVAAFEAEDGRPFRRDGWTRPAGGKLEGDGLSQLIEEGALLERGGCNFSHVQGASLPPSATQHRADLAGAPFEALGVSLVMHPRNPYVPTVHMNVRLLAAFPAGQPPVVWFGGGRQWRFVDAYRDELLRRIGRREPYFYSFKRILMWGRRQVASEIASRSPG